MEIVHVLDLGLPANMGRYVFGDDMWIYNIANGKRSKALYLPAVHPYFSPDFEKYIYFFESDKRHGTYSVNMYAHPNPVV